MKYDPNALPFWEQQRGGGPITKAYKATAAIAERMAAEDRWWMCRARVRSVSTALGNAKTGINKAKTLQDKARYRAKLQELETRRTALLEMMQEAEQILGYNPEKRSRCEPDDEAA